MTDTNVGVVVCDCNGTLNDRLDFEAIAAELQGMDAVRAVARCACLCDDQQCAAAVREIAAGGADRVAVGGCARALAGARLGDVLAGAQIKDGLFWGVNIAQQCGFVHGDAAAAGAKAAQRLKAAVQRLAHARAIESEQRPVQQDVVVVGGGVAGMQTAVALAGLGHNVTLVHKGAELGGLATAMPEFCGHLGGDPAVARDELQRLVADLAAAVAGNPAIRVCSGAQLQTVSGELGGFTVTVGVNGDAQALAAGAVVLATGAREEACTDAVGGGPRVVDMMQLGGMIRSEAVPAKVAILMDLVEEQGRAVSARVLSAAEWLAAEHGTQVTVYCQNVRVAATGMEALYRRARAAGVDFIKCARKPVVSAAEAGVTITCSDPVAGAEVAQSYDVAAVADVCAGDSLGGDRILPGLVRGPGGALQHDDVWLQPTCTNLRGVYAVGAARGNSELRDALTDGLAVAQEVHALLGQPVMDVLDDGATVESAKCVLCLTCVRVCPHGAISIDDVQNAAVVSAVSCRRCGACAAECPAKAIQLPRYTDAEVVADLGRVAKVTVFACENSALPAADAVTELDAEYGVDVALVRVPCAGKVDPRHVLRALEEGADKVLVLGCHPDSCQYLTGATRARERMASLGRVLEQAGVAAGRVRFGGIAAVEPRRFLEYVSDGALSAE